jgi:hypothetical protein
MIAGHKFSGIFQVSIEALFIPRYSGKFHYFRNWLDWCADRWPTPQKMLAEINAAGQGCPIALSRKVHDLISSRKRADERLATGFSFTLLLIVAHYVIVLSMGSAKTLRQLFSWGDGIGSGDRFSPLAWSKLVERERGTDLERFLASLLFDELLSRHIFTASRRADGSSNRLRIAYDGDRWTTFVRKPAAVPFTADRLSALVSLMKDCSLLSASDVAIE